MWPACSNFLLVLVCYNGVAWTLIQAIYPVCGADFETVEHILLFCQVVKRLWFAPSLGLRLDFPFTFHEFVLHFFLRYDLEVLELFIMLVYVL